MVQKPTRFLSRNYYMPFNTRILPNAESLCRSNEFFFAWCSFLKTCPGKGKERRRTCKAFTVFDTFELIQCQRFFFYLQVKESTLL